MHADRLRELRSWLATSMSPLGSSASWTVSVPLSAVVTGIRHRVRFGAYTASYVVEAGDTADDIASGIASDSASLASAIVPISVTSSGSDILATSSASFSCLPEPPLSTPAPSASIPVLWSNQSAPQPDSDFVSLTAGQDRGEGREEVEAGVHPVMETTEVRSLRIQTVEVLLIGEWVNVSADDVRRALESPSSVEALDPYVVRNIAVIVDRTSPNSTMWSTRVALSVEIAYSDARRVNGEAIETIEASGTAGSESLNITAP